MQKINASLLAGQFLTGLSLILVPMIFIFAFSVHPNLLHPQMLSPEELIQRAHNADVLHFAHVLVTFATIPLVAMAFKFKRVLSYGNSAWWGLIGGVVAIMGVVFLAVDKGALCLTMSAFDTLSESDFAASLPAIIALFTRQGYMILVWGIVFIPIGFAIQAIGLLKEKVLPVFEAGCFLAGVLLIGTPDGMEIINLIAAVLLGVGLVPYGVRLIMASLNHIQMDRA